MKSKVQKFYGWCLVGDYFSLNFGGDGTNFDRRNMKKEFRSWGMFDIDSIWLDRKKSSFMNVN